MYKVYSKQELIGFNKSLNEAVHFFKNLGHSGTNKDIKVLGILEKWNNWVVKEIRKYEQTRI